MGTGGYMKYPLKNYKGQHVGNYDTATGIVYKRVYETKHKLRVPEAWAFDRCIIDEILRISQMINILDRTEFHVDARDTGLLYKISWTKFRDKAFTIKRDGEQLAVILKEWEVEDSDSKQLSLFN
jgi:hypothetical protein